MIIDGSGSMKDVFPNVMDQAMLFAVFCYYAKIPCEIYMFSDVKSITGQQSTGLLTLSPRQSGQLVGSSTPSRTAARSGNSFARALRSRRTSNQSRA
jgi:hypothetical protein